MNNIAVLQKLICTTEQCLSSVQDMQHEWTEAHKGVEEADIALSISQTAENLGQLLTKLRSMVPPNVWLSHSILKYDDKTHYLIEGYWNGQPWSLLGTGRLETRRVGNQYKFVGRLLVERVTGTPRVDEAATRLCTIWYVNEVEVVFVPGLAPETDSREAG
jgi:hypothetical protein